MWIEVPNEVGDYLLTINNCTDYPSVAINTLLDSMFKGKHIIYMRRKLLKQLKEWHDINPTNKVLVEWLLNNYVYIYSIRDLLTHKIIVSIDQTISVSESKNEITDKTVLNYNVPLTYFYDAKETKLITENESDGKFYHNICRYISRCKRKKEKKNVWHTIKFENDSGHGSGVSQKIQQNAEDNRIGICILDSDKDTPKSKTGDTYKGANKSFKKFKNKSVMCLKALNAREKENLFPPMAYRLLYNDRANLFETLNKFIEDESIIRYFDFKDGIKYKKHLEQEWQEHYKEVVDALKEVGEYKIPSNATPADDYMCLKGIGDKACENVCCALLDQDDVSNKIINSIKVSRESKEEIKKIRKFEKEFLPNYLYKEWEDLYELLFSWGCCIDMDNKFRVKVE